MSLSAKEIVRQCGMSDRPGYYSGRGAITDDLSSTKLERIYQLIKTRVSEDAAASFVEMVDALPVASATDFLISLYKLEGNEWQWSSETLSNQNGIYPDCEGSAFFTVQEVMHGSNQRNDTDMIVSSFLRNHGKSRQPARTYYGYYK